MKRTILITPLSLVLNHARKFTDESCISLRLQTISSGKWLVWNHTVRETCHFGKQQLSVITYNINTLCNFIQKQLSRHT